MIFSHKINRKKASEDFHRAVKEGEVAFLMEQEDDDIFVTQYVIVVVVVCLFVEGECVLGEGGRERW